ncbi:MAG TPA: hypothetical protein VF326_02585 [Anaerolineaceae bacterium]|jgi:hypothetical protein
MPETTNPNYNISPDEKVAPVMAYMLNSIVWGDVIVKNAIRVGTWLRTHMAPDMLCLYNAKLLVTNSGGTTIHPLSLPEIHIPTAQIQAFLIVPPTKDPLDYDTNEPNRRMDPVTVISGAARIDGFMRFATMSNMKKYLEVNKENFSPIYDAEITNLAIPSLRAIHVQHVIVRQSTSMFMVRPI